MRKYHKFNKFHCNSFYSISNNLPENIQYLLLKLKPELGKQIQRNVNIKRQYYETVVIQPSCFTFIDLLTVFDDYVTLSI